MVPGLAFRADRINTSLLDFDPYFKNESKIFSIGMMTILKFRIYFEDDDSIYRDIAIRHTQSFRDLHDIILRSYEFDNKHAATFFRSNDHWQRGREITLEKYDKSYRAEPLIMAETTVGSEIRDPNQKFVYVYDFVKNWSFLVELIAVLKEDNGKITYPSIIRSEGIAPSQYGTKSLLGDRFVDVEEKYDLAQGEEGFGEEGEGGAEAESEDTEGEQENTEESTEF